MSGYFNPESARLKRLRGLYRRDPNAALREIYNPRTRVARRMSEDDINEPRTSIPTDTERRPNLYQNVTESRQELTEEPLPQNIGDYNIFQFKRAIQNNPAPIKQYINAIPWGPAGNFKAFDDFMTGQATIGQCIGLNCYQNSFLNLMANQAKTRSRDASPTRVYGEERGNIKGFTPTEGNFETLLIGCIDIQKKKVMTSKNTQALHLKVLKEKLHHKGSKRFVNVYLKACRLHLKKPPKDLVCFRN